MPDEGISIDMFACPCVHGRDLSTTTALLQAALELDAIVYPIRDGYRAAIHAPGCPWLG